MTNVARTDPNEHCVLPNGWIVIERVVYVIFVEYTTHDASLCAKDISQEHM